MLSPLKLFIWMPGIDSQIRSYILQSILSKVDNFGTAVSMCPSSRGVQLIEDQLKVVQKGRDQP